MGALNRISHVRRPIEGNPCERVPVDTELVQSLEQAGFRALTDDNGKEFRRGVRTIICADTYQRLQASAADSFWFGNGSSP